MSSCCFLLCLSLRVIITYDVFFFLYIIDNIVQKICLAHSLFKIVYVQYKPKCCLNKKNLIRPWNKRYLKLRWTVLIRDDLWEEIEDTLQYRQRRNNLNNWNKNRATDKQFSAPQYYKWNKSWHTWYCKKPSYNCKNDIRKAEFESWCVLIPKFPKMQKMALYLLNRNYWISA